MGRSQPGGAKMPWRTLSGPWRQPATSPDVPSTVSVNVPSPRAGVVTLPSVPWRMTRRCFPRFRQGAGINFLGRGEIAITAP
jgi:hypothetical protein